MKISLAFFLKIFLLPGFLVAILSGISQNTNPGFQTNDFRQLIAARKVTHIPNAISESSAIAVITPNHIWSLNDAGNTNEIFCFDTTGFMLKEVLVSNASNIDWEDLAVDNQNRMYINDAGNNMNNRHDLKILRIPDPDNLSGNVVQAEVINFTLEDQVQFPPPNSNFNYDIEAIIWKSDSLFLFTKNRCIPQTGICKLYSLPAQPGTYTAKLRDAIFLGTTDKEARVTSADINHLTGELLLLTETKIVSFTDYPGNRFFSGDMVSYYFSNTVGQIEGIAFADNERLYITEEGNDKSGGYLYEVKWKSTNAVQENLAEEFTVSPNPFLDKITIGHSFGKSFATEVFDVAGSLV